MAGRFSLGTGFVSHSLCAAALLGCGGGGAGAQSLPAASANGAPAGFASRVTAIAVAGTQALGTFEGVPYARTYGTLTGVLDGREAIVGLVSLAHDASGSYAYASDFEIVAPAGGATPNQTVFFEAENRGSSLTLGVLNGIPPAGAPSSASYAPGLGNGFLQHHATSYARVQWQTGIAAGVPVNAQGVGLAIVRDFARLLRGRTPAVTPSGGSALATYAKLILGGTSQSGWFVDTFVAEGFNADPVTGTAVFDGALAIDGTGNWLAINALAAANGSAPRPYVDPQGVPLTPDALLAHPASDPFFVDVARYTDFYRLHAGISDVPAAAANYRRYDWPSPHNNAGVPADPGIFASGCNGGTPVSLNPVPDAPYFRALVLALEKRIGAPGAASAPSLPPSAAFALVDAGATTANLNPLGALTLRVPQIDVNAMPIGGVRFPDADVPLGRPTPVSLPPVSTASIAATCGNYGMFQPFDGARLNALYGSRSAYLAKYDAALAQLIAQGYVLSDDEQPMLARAGALFDAYAR